jgi:hypothetical protein
VVNTTRFAFAFGVAWTALTHGAKAADHSDYKKGIVPDTYALLSLSPAATSALVADWKKLGVNWVRVAFDWSIVQPVQSGGYELAGYDKLVDVFARARINILGLLAYAPRWANGDQPSHFPPLDSHNFASFASYLAARYALRGVHTWEIWNEPNMPQFWKPRPDVAAYTKLLVTAHSAITKVDANSEVLSAGLAPAADTENSLSPATFLRGIYQSGGRGHFEAVGAHPYSFPATPDDPHPSNSWQQLSATPSNLREVMISNGDADKKIWLTEFGAPTSGRHPGHVSENKQAEVLARGYRLAYSYPWSGPLFWYDYQDICANPDDSECSFGLVRTDGSLKPAYFAFQAVPQRPARREP